MNDEQKKILLRLALSLAFLLLSFVTDEFKIVFLSLSYILAGYDVVLDSLKSILHGEFLDENFLMSIATFAAFWIGEYSEAVAVMFFYQIGDFFEEYAVSNSRNSIKDLMDI